MTAPLPTVIPGLALYRQVRAGFVAQGTTLNAWCKTNGVRREHARACLTGSWNGPKGRELRMRLVQVGGVQMGGESA